MANVKPDVRILTDLEDISRTAADLFAETAREAVEARGHFLVALSGGNTPVALYRLLAQEPYRDQVNWDRTIVFWGDERCVPPEAAGNSYFQTKEVLLDRVPIPGKNVHRVRSEMNSTDSAADYARVLREAAHDYGADPGHEWPRFDLVLLGMGDDAHTASLFPGSPADISTPTVAVSAEYQDRPAQRVSLTPIVFNAARKVVFLVSGESKAEALAKVLLGDYHPENLPAQRIRPEDGELIWLVDQAAAIGIAGSEE